MLIAYFTTNFITLLLLSAVIVTMIVNKNYEIPVSDLFFLGIAMLLVITVFDTVSDLCEINDPSLGLTLAGAARLRKITGAISYILRPFVVMIEIMVIMPPSKYKALTALPAGINLVIYSTAFMDSEIAFTITEDNVFIRGPLGYSIYAAQLFYVVMLIIISVDHFKMHSGSGRNAIVILILVQTITVALLEYFNILTGYSNIVTALAILEYYIYLSIIYQQGIKNTVIEREAELEKEKLLLLRSQIHPHFIYNSLSVIRSLAKRDSERAVNCIDNFSDYLKAHIRAIEHEELIPFETELKSVEAYLKLVKSDRTRKLEVNYDLQAVDFLIPPLSLEPIVENAVMHGVSKYDGRIEITSCETESCYIVTISDNGSANNSLVDNTPIHLGIGIENTRRRLDLLCGGSLKVDFGNSGTVVEISIPINERIANNENTDS